MSLKAIVRLSKGHKESLRACKLFEVEVVEHEVGRGADDEKNVIVAVNVKLTRLLRLKLKRESFSQVNHRIKRSLECFFVIRIAIDDENLCLEHIRQRKELPIVLNHDGSSKSVLENLGRRLLRLLHFLLCQHPLNIEIVALEVEVRTDAASVHRVLPKHVYVTGHCAFQVELLREHRVVHQPVLVVEKFILVCLRHFAELLRGSQRVNIAHVRHVHNQMNVIQVALRAQQMIDDRQLSRTLEILVEVLNLFLEDSGQGCVLEPQIVK